ncbi:conjugal transfer protein TraD [Salmonella enterica]|nr:hypothetical protein [Salmonella enterica]EDM3212352.1 hypothetical protein [Salmonella enterica subsp. enterica serovar Berta]EEU4959392.1 conjugal transfer protein TraD [Salmonella enterica]EGC1788738.1 conjugal transfer protein TraD [Salmonella enterica]EGH6777712.1 conjugal transfer protein TraD [Salmonella enterica]
MSKDLEQQIASAQNRLNMLKKKKINEDRRKRTHDLIVLGAECLKLADGNRNLVIGALLYVDNMTEAQKNMLKIKGEHYFNKNAEK